MNMWRKINQKSYKQTLKEEVEKEIALPMVQSIDEKVVKEIQQSIVEQAKKELIIEVEKPIKNEKIEEKTVDKSKPRKQVMARISKHPERFRNRKRRNQRLEDKLKQTIR